MALIIFKRHIEKQCDSNAIRAIRKRIQNDRRKTSRERERQTGKRLRASRRVTARP